MKKSFGKSEVKDEDVEEYAFWVFMHILYSKNWCEIYKDGLAK